MATQAMSEGIRTVRPRVIDVSSELLRISRQEMKVKIGDKQLIFIEKRNKGYVITIFAVDEKGNLVHYSPISIGHPSEIHEYDIDNDLKNVVAHYISNWDFLLKMREAELLLNGPIKVVPQSISDREALAYEIAKKIRESRTIKAFYTGDTVLGIYCFDNAKGVYIPCEEELKAEIAKLTSKEPEIAQKTTRWVINEALTKIRELTKEKWRPNLKVLSFNGVLFDWSTFLETGDIEASISELDPEMQVFHHIPHRLNLEKVRRIRKSKEGLERYLPPRGSEDVLELFRVLAPKSYEAFKAWVGEGLVPLLLEIIGYTLYPGDYPLSKAIMLVGDGSNGKTTYLRLIREILGNHNIAGVDLKTLTENRFMANELFLKLANISAEPVRGILKNTEVFKKLTGGDFITADRKNRDPIHFVNYAKLIFAANELPNVTEDTYAFWRRWIVIEFPNTFPEDPGFYERTFTEEEVEGVILAALYAFYLVMKRRKFSVLESHDPKEQWLRRSNSAYRVLKELEEKGIIEFAPNSYVIKDDLYQLYTTYIKKLEEEEDETIEVVSKKRFTETLERFFGVRSARAPKQINGRRPKIYQGVRIKDYEKYEKIVGRYPETPKPLLRC